MTRIDWISMNNLVLLVIICVLQIRGTVGLARVVLFLHSPRYPSRQGTAQVAH